MEGPVQCRFGGELKRFSTVAEARQAFLANPQIEKISFDGKRFLPVFYRDLQTWETKYLTKIRELCPELFSDTNDSKENQGKDHGLIWVNQKILNQKTIHLAETDEDAYFASCIVEVLLDADFIRLYCQ